MLYGPLARCGEAASSPPVRPLIRPHPTLPGNSSKTVPQSFSDSLRLAADAARSAGLGVRFLDPHSGYLIAVEDGRRRTVLGGGAACPYPMNGATAVSLARDKGHAALLLAEAGLPVPDGAVFFTDDRWRDLRGPGRELADAVEYAEGLGWPVFVKPVDGSRGAHAGLAADAADLARHFAAMAPRHPVALVQRPIAGPEWRVVVFDGRVEWGYRRADAVLRGDGRRSVAALVAAENAALRSKGLDPVPADDAFLAERLAEAGATLDTVLDPGVCVRFTPRRNVAGGGGVAALLDPVPTDLAHVAVAATAALGLRLAGVDIVGELGGRLTVLEVNGTPALGGIEAVGAGAQVADLWTRLLRTCLADPALSRPVSGR